MHGDADFESVKMPAAAAKLEEERKHFGMRMAQFLVHLRPMIPMSVGANEVRFFISRMIPQGQVFRY